MKYAHWLTASELGTPLGITWIIQTGWILQYLNIAITFRRENKYSFPFFYQIVYCISTHLLLVEETELEVFSIPIPMSHVPCPMFQDPNIQNKFFLSLFGNVRKKRSNSEWKFCLFSYDTVKAFIRVSGYDMCICVDMY